MTAFMSRTDKTNPYRVKVHEKHEFLEEVHDHTNGVCDLPERPSRGSFDTTYWKSDGSCFWHAARAFYHDPIARCGCPMCGWDAYSTPRRKRERQAAREYCQDKWNEEY